MSQTKGKDIKGLTLDAGALIAFDRCDRRVVVLLDEAERAGLSVVIPAGALAQAWRGGPRQARLARLVGSPPVQVVPLDEHAARVAGELCGVVGHFDVIDASVALCAAQRGHAVVTSDPGDIGKLNPHLRLIIV